MDTFLGPRQVQKLLLARARAPVRRDRGPVRAADGRVQVLGQRRGPLQRVHGPRSDSRDLPWSRRGGPEGPLRWQALEEGQRPSREFRAIASIQFSHVHWKHPWNLVDP